MSEKCHCGREQSQQCSCLFDHLVSKREQLVWNLEAERLRRFEVDYQVKFGRLHDRQVGRLGTFENPTGVDTNLTLCLGTADSITHQTACCCELAPRVDRGYSMACR